MPLSAPGIQNGTQYELWLARDDGTRLKVLDLAGPFTFTRVLNNVGFFSILLPVGFDRTLLAKDRRIYIWRRPVGGALGLAFEGLLRVIRSRTDSAGNLARFIQGPDLVDLLNRRVCAYPVGNANVTISATAADNVLKSIVSTNLGSSATTGNGRKAAGSISSTYLSVAPNDSLAPVITRNFSYRNVLDICREIADASRQAGTDLYFDIVPLNEDGSSHTFEFRTYINQVGKDRTADSAAPLTFGVEFDNLAEPELVEDCSDEVNRAYGLGYGQGSAREIDYSEDTTRQLLSQFALSEAAVPAPTATTALDVTAAANAAVTAGRGKVVLTGRLQSVPGFVYGLDWNFGDRVAVNYDGRTFDGLVRSVTITVDEHGYENIDASLEAYLT